MSTKQLARAHSGRSSALAVGSRTGVSAERSRAQARARRGYLLERAPRQLGAGMSLLLSLVAACGSGDPHAEPAGSASPPAGAASETPAPVAVGASRAPAASTVAMDTAPSNAAAGGTANGTPNELPDPKLNPAPAAVTDPSSCNPDTAADSFEQSCVACAGSDACASCLCSACTDEVQRCVQTSGCMEILACGRASGCSGMACYCGGADAVSCLNGNADGDCRGVIEGAPGGRAPSIREPSAGPAADRASAVAQCMQRDEACRGACGAP
jgi:hypothetical protein